MENQLEILKSEAVALNVIDRLGLWSDPEFVREGPGLSDRIGALIGLAPTTPEFLDKRRAAPCPASPSPCRFDGLGESHIIEVRFFSLEPAKSAAIANEIARVYLQRQFSDNSDAARTASAWLRARSAEGGPLDEGPYACVSPHLQVGAERCQNRGRVRRARLRLRPCRRLCGRGNDRGVRTQEAAAAALETDCFGTLPRVRGHRAGGGSGALSITPPFSRVLISPMCCTMRDWARNPSPRPRQSGRSA